MRIEVLGCSGGIGDGRQTTSLLVDEDVLIDAGSGVLNMDIERLKRIDHIFVTHTHLDHILAIPLLIDSVGALRDTPVTVHASTAVLQILHCNIFNWFIWPDFSRIPTEKAPFLRFSPLEEGETFELPGNRSVTSLPANHVIPASGFDIGCEDGHIVFSGDTSYCQAFWDRVNEIEGLKYLIIETAFSEEEIQIAEVSKHLSPSMVMESLKAFQGQADVYISHLKPGQEDRIMHQIEQQPGRHRPKRLLQEQVLEI